MVSLYEGDIDSYNYINMSINRSVFLENKVQYLKNTKLWLQDLMCTDPIADGKRYWCKHMITDKKQKCLYL